MHIARLIRLAVVGGAAWMAACASPTNSDGSADGNRAAAASIVSGDGQTGEVGELLEQPLTVRVAGPGGGPIADVAVTFAVTAGDGAVQASSVTTDAQGIASTMWTLGALAVGEQAVTATVPSTTARPILFTATGKPARYRITIVAGDKQAGPVRQALPIPLTVEVRDVTGKAVPGVGIQWTVAPSSGPGPGTLTSVVSQTDAAGRATATYALPYRGGYSAVSATVAQPQGHEVLFEASAIPAPPARLVAAPILDSVSFTGITVFDSVRVFDTYDEPATNVAVRWTMFDGSGGSVVAASMTNGLGFAKISRVVGGVIDGQALVTEATVSQPGVTPVSFSRTVRTPVLQIIAGDNQVAVLGQPLQVPLVVAVTDLSGAPLPGVSLSWGLYSAEELGPVGGFSNATDAAGRASASSLGPSSNLFVDWVAVRIAGLQNPIAQFSLLRSTP